MTRPVFVDGMVHVNERMCETCIFRPGNLMGLEPGRVEDVVKQNVDAGAALPCHSTLDGDQQAVCRGFFDRHATAPLQIAERLGFIKFVSFSVCNTQPDTSIEGALPMSNNTEWSTLNDDPPVLFEPGEFEDNNGSKNDQHCLVVGGCAIEGTPAVWLAVAAEIAAKFGPAPTSDGELIAALRANGGGTLGPTGYKALAVLVERSARMTGATTLTELQALHPDAAIEEVGDRRELVIYTGLAVATYDPENDDWTDAPNGLLVPMPTDDELPT